MIYFEFRRAAAVLPAISPDLLRRAGRDELALLVALASDPALLSADRAALAAAVGLSPETTEGALRFWVGAGLLSEEAAAEAPAPRADAATLAAAARLTPSAAPADREPTVTVPKRTALSELPRYTSAEVERIMAAKPSAKGLIDEAQQALGKVFVSHAEVARLLALSEELGLCDEYLLMLLAHCRELDKCSMRYAEKLAVSLYDSGITSPEALSEYLINGKRAASEESHIKRLLGMSRSLTAKEKAMVGAWVGAMGFSGEMLELAFELAAEATVNPNIAYLNSILTRWHEVGVKTPDDAARDKQAHKAATEAAPPKPKKSTSAKPSPNPNPSFDVDEFFAAAIRRGYEEK